MQDRVPKTGCAWSYCAHEFDSLVNRRMRCLSQVNDLVGRNAQRIADIGLDVARTCEAPVDDLIERSLRTDNAQSQERREGAVLLRYGRLVNCRFYHFLCVSLAAAHLLDIDEVYAVGSAWAIAALAYGTQSIAPVDVIAGPGNIFVTTAKRLVQGRVGIDMIAGPSEVLVLADSSANPAWVAADMLSQAEHDAMASAMCITDNQSVAEAVLRELEAQLRSLPRADLARQSLRDWGAVVVAPTMRLAIALTNRAAPEHLELAVRDPWAVLPHIRHAGAVFMGHSAPEAVGDYYAGPNHVLPTMGTARFSSALSVQTFCKKSSIVAISPDFIQRHGAAIARLARLEGLEAHARSIETRTGETRADQG